MLTQMHPCTCVWQATAVHGSQITPLRTFDVADMPFESSRLVPGAMGTVLTQL